MRLLSLILMTILSAVGAYHILKMFWIWLFDEGYKGKHRKTPWYKIGTPWYYDDSYY